MPFTARRPAPIAAATGFGRRERTSTGCRQALPGILHMTMIRTILLDAYRMSFMGLRETYRGGVARAGTRIAAALALWQHKQQPVIR